MGGVVISSYTQGEFTGSIDIYQCLETVLKSFDALKAHRRRFLLGGESCTRNIYIKVLPLSSRKFGKYLELCVLCLRGSPVTFWPIRVLFIVHSAVAVFRFTNSLT